MDQQEGAQGTKEGPKEGQPCEPREDAKIIDMCLSDHHKQYAL